MKLFSFALMGFPPSKIPPYIIKPFRVIYHLVPAFQTLNRNYYSEGSSSLTSYALN